MGDEEPKSVAGVECRAEDGEGDHTSLLVVGKYNSVGRDAWKVYLSTRLRQYFLPASISEVQ